MSQQKTLREVLEGKLAAAQADDKVLNVSNLREDGVGAVKAKRPATSGKDAKGATKYIEGLDIISNAYGPYKVAAEALGFPEFAREYRKLYGGGAATPKGTKSPKKEKTEPKGFGERLLEAVENAQKEDKLVDVSNLHELKNGGLGGFRTINRYDPKTRKDLFGDKYTGKKVWIAGLPIISNNFDSYARALNALDRGDLVREFARKHGEGYDHRTQKGVKSPAKSPRARGTAAGAKSAAEQLYDQYSKAVNTAGKLDVSALDAAKGTGSRVIYPKSDREITRVGVPGFEVVSNSFEKFALAMALLDEFYAENDQEGGFAARADEYFEVHQEGPGKRVAGASPKAKTPKRVRAKSIPKTGSAGSRSSSVERRSGSAGRPRSGSAGRPRSGSAGRATSTSPTRGQTSTLADRLQSAASLERMRSASQERRARSASQGRSSSRSRSGSAGILPVPDLI